MKKLLSIVLCLILCFSMFSCNKEKPAETTATTSGTEDTELITAPLVNSDGIMSMVIVGEGNENREDKVTGTVILGPLRGEESGYRDYTIEYYSPNDAEYVKTVTDYINSHKLKLLEGSPVIPKRPVNFTIGYFNGDTVFVKGYEQFLGVRNTNNGEYTWYEMKEETVITPQAFFETIERPPQPTTPEDSTVSTDQNAVRLSVPLVDGKIVFPDKDIKYVFIVKSHYAVGDNKFMLQHGQNAVKTFFESLVLGEKLDELKEYAGADNYSVKFYFADGTYISFGICGDCLSFNGLIYDIGLKIHDFRSIIRNLI